MMQTACAAPRHFRIRTSKQADALQPRAWFSCVLVTLLLLGVAVLSACSTDAAAAAPASEGSASVRPNITVSATSELKVVPDKAKISVGVTTQAATAQDAQSTNAEALDAVIFALRDCGIDDKSIQTTSTWLSPRYDYSSPSPALTDTDASEEFLGPYEDSASSSSSTNIVGYEMTTQLSVSDLDIDRVGEVLQRCVDAGANTGDGIHYYSSEYDAKYAEALASAVEAARQKAETLAQAGGVQLGGIISITEGYQNTNYQYTTGASIEEFAADAALSVMPGEVGVDANVTVSYEIS